MQQDLHYCQIVICSNLKLHNFCFSFQLVSEYSMILSVHLSSFFVYSYKHLKCSQTFIDKNNVRSVVSY